MKLFTSLLRYVCATGGGGGGGGGGPDPPQSAMIGRYNNIHRQR